MPKVSIIIPVYNVETYLSECLDSIVCQTLKEIEILCMDDGSTDGSLDILQHYSSADPRVRVIKTTTNQGAGGARNLGLRHATGKYVAFMDADDLYPNENTLHTLYTIAIRENVKICGGSMIYLKKDGSLRSDFSGAYSGQVFTSSGMCSYDEYQFAYGFYRFIYLRTMLLENEIFFPDYRRFQDPPFMVKAMLCAGKFYHIPDVTYVYRIGHVKVNWTLEKARDCIRGLTEVMEIAEKFKLPRLHSSMKAYLLDLYFEGFLAQADSPEVINLLNKTNAMMDFTLMEQEYKRLGSSLQGTDIVVYGTGDTGKAIAYCLQRNTDIHLLGVCNSKTTTERVWNYLDAELPLRSIQAWKQFAPDATILIATQEEHHAEIVKACENAGFEVVIPLREDMRIAVFGREYCKRFRPEQ